MKAMLGLSGEDVEAEIDQIFSSSSLLGIRRGLEGWMTGKASDMANKARYMSIAVGFVLLQKCISPTWRDTSLLLLRLLVQGWRREAWGSICRYAAKQVSERAIDLGHSVAEEMERLEVDYRISSASGDGASSEEALGEEGLIDEPSIEPIIESSKAADRENLLLRRNMNELSSAFSGARERHNDLMVRHDELHLAYDESSRGRRAAEATLEAWKLEAMRSRALPKGEMEEVANSARQEYHELGSKVSPMGRRTSSSPGWSSFLASFFLCGLWFVSFLVFLLGVLCAVIKHIDDTPKLF